jgi:hypothetical protein
VEHSKACDEERPQYVGADHDRPARVSVGDQSPKGAEQKNGQDLKDDGGRHADARASEPEHQDNEGDGVEGIACPGNGVRQE